MRESSKGVGGGGLEISDFMNFHSKIVEKRPHPPRQTKISLGTPTPR